MKPTSLILATLLVAVPATARSQEPALELPLAALHAIAVDFDRGLNPIYCYFGSRHERPSVIVAVDSVTTVSTPSDCPGIGIGFVARIPDRGFLANALKGLIESNARFMVASAFYRTEEIDHDGSPMLAARSLSVIRGGVTAVSQGGP